MIGFFHRSGLSYPPLTLPALPGLLTLHATSQETPYLLVLLMLMVLSASPLIPMYFEEGVSVFTYVSGA